MLPASMHEKVDDDDEGVAFGVVMMVGVRFEVLVIAVITVLVSLSLSICRKVLMLLPFTGMPLVRMISISGSAATNELDSL